MIKLEDVGMGVLAERFDSCLCKIIDNVLDVNTSAKKQREIHITFKIKPNPEDREECDIELSCEPKLAPRKEYVSQILIGKDHSTGEVDCNERVVSQRPLFPEPEKPQGENVVNMKRQQRG